MVEAKAGYASVVEGFLSTREQAGAKAPSGLRAIWETNGKDRLVGVIVGHLV
jgi:hypothetical protein